MSKYVMKFTEDAFVVNEIITAAQSTHLNRYYVSFDPVTGVVTTPSLSQATRFDTLLAVSEAWHQTADPQTWQDAYYNPEASGHDPFDRNFPLPPGEPYQPLMMRYSVRFIEVAA